MIEILNKEHFLKTVRFARDIGGDARKSFIDCLTVLNNIKRNTGNKLNIGPDWVKHSFSFGFLNKDGQCTLNGGMILHGFEPTFSVQLTKKNGPNWSIHT